jgi:hypothetical protein
MLVAIRHCRLRFFSAQPALQISLGERLLDHHIRHLDQIAVVPTFQDSTHPTLARTRQPACGNVDRCAVTQTLDPAGPT